MEKSVLSTSAAASESLRWSEAPEPAAKPKNRPWGKVKVGLVGDLFRLGAAWRAEPRRTAQQVIAITQIFGCGAVHGAVSLAEACSSAASFLGAPTLQGALTLAARDGQTVLMSGPPTGASRSAKRLRKV